MPRAHLALALACSLLPSVALAQVAGAPTHGVRFPNELVTGMDGAAALESNPAGLGFLDGWDFVIEHTEAEDGVGRGTAALFGLRLFGPIVVGADVQLLRPEAFADTFKGGFGIALSPSPSFSLGLAYHGLISDDDPGLDALSALDLGLIWRPFHWLAIGADVHDLTTPVLHGKPIPRSYDVGFALRPGTARFTFEAEVRINEDNGDSDPAARLLFDPAEGFHVGLGARLLPRGSDLGLMTTATLGFDWARIGVESGAYVDVPAGSGEVEYAGVSAGLRVTNEPRLSIGRPGGVYVDVVFDGVPSEASSPGVLGGGRVAFTSVIAYLERLRGDDHVDGVVFRLRSFDAGWGQVEELRAAAMRLRDSGKHVYFHFAELGTRGYYLATAGEGVWVEPPGGIWLTGLYSSHLYYEKILDTIGVRAQFIKYGKYKSFPEAFTRTGPSDGADEVQGSLMDALYGQVVTAIAGARKKTEEEVRTIVDQGPYTSQAAVDAGLVEGAIYYDEMEDTLRERLGFPVQLRHGYLPESPLWPQWGEPDRIAVIAIEGSLVEGTSSTVPLLGMRMAGSRTIEAAIDAALGDSSVKAIILRIDSPGGASLSADHVWRKVVNAKKSKPVIISMSNVCASGGYYIAAAGDRVFADAATYTGSIGIFTGKFSVTRLFEIIGVNQVAWKRGSNADLLTFERPWTDEQSKMMYDKLGFYYRQFLEAVSKGRGMTVEEVDAVAQGRVWLGSQALEHKLVDEVGGIHEAILAAKAAAGMDPDHPIAIRMLPERPFFERLFSEVLPTLPVLAEVGAPLPVEAERPATAEQTATDAVLQAIAPLIRQRLGALVDILPYASGEPLAMLPFRIDNGQETPRK